MKNLGSRVAVQTSRLRRQSSSWREQSAGSTERGYTYAWQQARASFLAKNPLCVMCEERGLIEQATVVDHRIPHRGDMTLFWDKTNWQSLCAPCHNSVKQRQENGVGP